MLRLEWDSTLCMGIPEVDEQHRNLVLMLQALEETIRTVPTKDQVYGSILDMMEFVSVHFAQEERMMEPYAARMESYAEHLRQHKEFMKTTLDLAGRFREEGAALAGEIYTLLYTWIVDHISIMDRAMSRELRSLGAL